LTQTTFVYPPELAEPVLSWFHTARHEVPASVELVAVGTADGLVVDGLCFEDDPARAAAALAPLRTCPLAGRALASRVAAPATMDALRAEQVRANPEGHRYVVDNAYLAGGAGDVVPRLAPAFAARPTPASFALWFDLAGMPARPLPDMALSLYSDLYFAAYLVSRDPADDGRNRDWLEERMTDLEPVSTGCYLGDSDFTRRPQKFLSDDAYRRLGQIRADRDPAGVFPDYLIAAGATINAGRAAR
jgi:hypothetical protein